MMLPVSAPHTTQGFELPPTGRGSGLRVPTVFKRLHRVQQMDFEAAAWQLAYLCLSPRRVYRNVYFHKQTKNTWARDDPAIIVLVGALLCVSAIAWGLVYSYSFRHIISTALSMIFIDFLLSGVIISTILWFVARHLLLSPPTHTALVDSTVEWPYVFDVHTNAFFPFYLTLYVAQLFLLPVILKDNWLCLWLGNTLYLVGFAQYTYGVYLGFNALPFLVRSELLLAPLLPLFALYIISLLGFHVAQHVLGAYFS